MRIHKFETTEAFIAIDLADAEASSGPVRWAKKVLQGGAKDLARSQTYTYAALEMNRGGASAGISAEPSERGPAIEAFIAEAEALVAAGTYLPDAAKGIGAAELEPLHESDPRATARIGELAEQADAVSAVVSADTFAGLDGRTIALEGLDAFGLRIATAAADRGATLTAISTATGTVTDSSGIALDTLAAAFAEHGADCVAELGEVGHAKAIFGSGADILFAGSKMGAIDHVAADHLAGSAAVVPSGRLPLTARALAVLRRGGVAAPADFVALAGSTIALWADPNSSDDDILAEVAATVGALCTDHRAHDDGPFLAACFAAEAHLATWQDELPFGRPLAP